MVDYGRFSVLYLNIYIVNVTTLVYNGSVLSINNLHCLLYWELQYVALLIFQYNCPSNKSTFNVGAYADGGGIMRQLM